MDAELSKIPGVLWNFSQPISDNMEEAVSGVKGELAVKMYGDDLKELETKGEEVVNVMRSVKGIEDLGLFRVLGQPNLNLKINRNKASRYGINVSDVQDAVETAIGGKAVTQVLQSSGTIWWCATWLRIAIRERLSIIFASSLPRGKEYPSRS